MSVHEVLQRRLVLSRVYTRYYNIDWYCHHYTRGITT